MTSTLTSEQEVNPRPPISPSTFIFSCLGVFSSSLSPLGLFLLVSTHLRFASSFRSSHRRLLPNSISLLSHRPKSIPRTILSPAHASGSALDFCLVSCSAVSSTPLLSRPSFRPHLSSTMASPPPPSPPGSPRTPPVLQLALLLALDPPPLVPLPRRPSSEKKRVWGVPFPTSRGGTTSHQSGGIWRPR